MSSLPAPLGPPLETYMNQSCLFLACFSSASFRNCLGLPLETSLLSSSVVPLPCLLAFHDCITESSIFAYAYYTTGHRPIFFLHLPTAACLLQVWASPYVALAFNNCSVFVAGLGIIFELLHTSEFCLLLYLSTIDATDIESSVNYLVLQYLKNAILSY